MRYLICDVISSHCLKLRYW